MERKYSYDIVSPNSDYANDPERSLVTVQVLETEFSDPTLSGALLLCFVSSGQERRVSLTSSERMCWRMHGPEQNLMIRVLRKRVLGSTVVASCGPIPIRQLGLEKRPLDRKFLLIGASGTRVGKIRLKLSAAYEQSDLHLYISSLHSVVVKKLLDKTAVLDRSPHFVLSDTSSSHDPTAADQSLPNGAGDGDGDEETTGVMGYMLDLGEHGNGDSELEDEIRSRWSSDADSSLEETRGARFPWVLAPTVFQLKEAVSSVQGSWKRISETCDIGRMVDVFYATASGNPRVKVLFDHVDMKAQKEKLSSALSLVLENLHDSKSVLQILRDLAIRHVDYGVELDHYNDIGNALVACLADADPAIASDSGLNFAWRLAYTMIATTMMEAARPMYQQRGALPPGLELLGGDGAYPSLFYQFNERFQTAVSSIWRKVGSQSLAWQELADVCDDFEACAQNLGRIIISEQYCAEKTIKPLQGAGGTLGGIKYCEQGVFFKFAIPDGKFILTHDAAQKVAGHELKNCSSYFQANVEGLHLPLVHLIDYAGFRLCATSLLPINGNTLSVGTNNGGKDVYARDGKLLRLLFKAGKFLNLSEHAVGSFVLPSAADIEGHYSVTDGRRYAIDFSRAFPCDYESVRASKSSESPYVQMLRPELVMRNQEQPLNPDAFSGFQGTGGAADAASYQFDCEAVAAASKKIIESCKELVQALEASLTANVNLTDFCDSLSRIFHFHGVNMRYLGQVARLSQSQELEVLLRAEMCARTAKRRLRRCWREMLQSNGGYGIVSSLKRVAAEFLSTLLSQDETVWAENIIGPLERYFRLVWPLKGEAPRKAAGSVSVVNVTSDVQHSPLLRRSRTKSMENATKTQRLETERVRTESMAAMGGTEPFSLFGGNREPAFLEELAPDQLKSQIFAVFFHRVCKMTGMEPSTRALHIVQSASSSSKAPQPRLNPSDIVVNPRCKSMNIAETGRAMSMWEQGQRDLAVCHFENALNGPLVSGTLLANYAECLSELDPRDPRVASLFQQATELSSDALICIKVAAWKEALDLDEARLLWLRALSAAPSAVVGAQCHGYIRCLSKMGLTEEALQISEALKKFEKADDSI